MSASTTPSAGAIAAANKWIEPTEGNRMHEESVLALAQVIDEETHAPELLQAARLSLRNVDGMLHRLPLNCDPTEAAAMTEWKARLLRALEAAP